MKLGDLASSSCLMCLWEWEEIIPCFLVFGSPGRMVNEVFGFFCFVCLFWHVSCLPFFFVCVCFSHFSISNDAVTCLVYFTLFLFFFFDCQKYMVKIHNTVSFADPKEGHLQSLFVIAKWHKTHMAGRYTVRKMWN